MFKEDQRDDNRTTKIDTKGLPITRDVIIHAAKHLKKALLVVQMLIERCRDINTNVYLCFIDFSRAFDLVIHDRHVEEWNLMV